MSNVRAEVANALHWAVAIPRHRVTADVDDGVVTLHGIVERAYQRSHAEAIVRHVPGVTAVKNEISIRATEELREFRLASLTPARALFSLRRSPCGSLDKHVNSRRSLVAFNTVNAAGKTLGRIESHREELHDV